MPIFEVHLAMLRDKGVIVSTIELPDRLLRGREREELRNSSTRSKPYSCLDKFNLQNVMRFYYNMKGHIQSKHPNRC